MSLRKSLRLEWFSDQIAPYINLSGRVPLTFRSSDELTIADDGTDKFALFAGATGRSFRHGIKKRLDRVAAKYGIDRYVSVRPGDLVVNCGANIGTLSIALANRGATVIAIEPDPIPLQALRWNAGRQPNVDVVPIGLWNEDGPLTFYQAPLTADTSAINEDGPPITIAARRLDTLMAERGIDRLRLLAGDAEGAEPEVVEGATSILAHTDYFAMECGYERRGERTLEKVSDLLKVRGFAIVHISRRNMLIARNRALLS